MYILDYISAHDHESFEKTMRKESVNKLYAFGSSLSSDKPNDIDLLIELDEKHPLKRGESLLYLWDYFESFFNKKVDMLTPDSLKNPTLLEEIEKTKHLIYAKEQQKVFG